MAQYDDDDIRALTTFETPDQKHERELQYINDEAVARGQADGSVGDWLDTIWKSTKSSFVSGFAGDAKTLDYMFDADVTKWGHNSLKEIADEISARKSNRAKIAASKKFIEEDRPTPYHTERELGDAWGDIYAYAELAGSGVGSIAAMFLGGGAIKLTAKLGLKGMTRKAMRKEADRIAAANKNISHEAAMEMAQKKTIDLAKKYDTALGMASYGTAESAIVSGSVGQAIEEEIMRAPANVLNESPRFKELYAELVKTAPTPDAAHNAARAALSREAGIEGAKTVAIPSFMLGSVAGHYVERAITGRLSPSVLKNFLILEAAELPTEAAQGATEQYVQNKIYKEYADNSRDVWEDVMEAGIKEGLGVGLGVAPLSAITATSEARAQKAGAAPTEEDVSLTEEAGDEDDTSDIDEMEPGSPPDEPPPGGGPAVETPADDEIEIPLTPEEINRQLDEAEAAKEAETETPVPTPPEEVVPPDTTQGPQAEPPAVEPPVEEPPVTEPPVAPPETPVEEPPVTEPPTTEPPVTEPPVAAETPAHKMDFPTFRQAAETGAIKPPLTEAATAVAALTAGTKADIGDTVSTLSRPEANAVAKGLGLKTAKSRKNLDDSISFVSDLANQDIDAMDAPTIQSTVEAMDQMSRNPVPKRAGGRVLPPVMRLKNYQQQIGDSAQEVYARQQHREAIEDAVETGDFTIEDFNALPEADQRAYADIGRQLRSKMTDDDIDKVVKEIEEGGEEPTPPDTTQGPEVEKPTEPTEELKPVDEMTKAELEDELGLGPTLQDEEYLRKLVERKRAEKGTETTQPPPDDTAGPAAPPTAEPPTPPKTPTKPKKEAPAEPETTAEAQAVLDFLAEAKEGDRLVISGTKMNGTPAKDRQINFIEKTDTGAKVNQGEKKPLTIELMKGNAVLRVGGKTKTMIVTGIKPSEKKIKIVDTEGNINGTLTRLNEMFKNEKPTLGEAEKLIKKIDALVSKANNIRAIQLDPDVTPGTVRMLEDIFSEFNTFYEWVGPMAGGGTKDYDYSFKEAIKRALSGNPLNRSKLQDITDVQDMVNTYMEFMREVRELFNGATSVRDVTNRWADREWDAAGFWIQVEQAEAGDIFRPSEIGNRDDSLAKKYPGIAPERSLGKNKLRLKYNEHLAHEDITQENYDFAPQKVKLEDLYGGRAGLPDHRKGVNVTGEQLQETFGLAGITYGKHVQRTATIDPTKAKDLPPDDPSVISEAQLYRNMAYDAFMDLSLTTGIPAEAVGHNIYLSIGALGRGKRFSAFWSPNWPKIAVDDNREDLMDLLSANNVPYDDDANINVLREKASKVIKRKNARIDTVRVFHFNRSNGDGSIGHEWAHSFGHRMGLIERGAAQELKYKMSFSSIWQHIQNEIKDFIEAEEDDTAESTREQNLLNSIKYELNYGAHRYRTETSYYSEAKKIKPADYWSNDKELFARAVEAYLFDTLKGSDQFNPFLQSNKAGDGVITGSSGYRGTPYPTGEERHHFNQMIANIFAGITMDENGEVEDKADRSKFGTNAQMHAVVSGIIEEVTDEEGNLITSLNELVKWAAEERLEYLLALQEGEFADDDADAEMKKLTDADIENLVNNSDPDPVEKPKRAPRGGRGGGGTGGGTGGGRPTVKGPTPSEKAKGIFEDNGIDPGLNDDIDDIFGEMPSTSGAMYSLDGEPGVDPDIYTKLRTAFSKMYHDFKQSGEKTPAMFVKVVMQARGNDPRIKPYLIQFMKEFTSGQINYRDYLDADRAAVDAKAKRDADDKSGKGKDDADPSEESTGGEDAGGLEDGDGQGARSGEAGDRSRGRTDDDLRNAEFNELSDREQAERIFLETGMESSSVVPISRTVVKEDKAQLTRRSVVTPGDKEIDYSVPASQANDQFNAILSLQEEVGDLEQYVANELQYGSVEEMRDGLMSLQVETIAAAVHQMKERGKSIIIADQTGVGKGRQAGGIIRWAQRNGKVPVFITEKPTLYTDMFYDMVDSGTDDIVPLVTNSKEGVKKRKPEGKEDAPDEIMFSNPDTKKLMADLGRVGKLPGDANALFTTYAQLGQANRRAALSKLAENEDVVLIMDESHTAAGETSNINAYLSDLIPNAYGSTFLSATFAKRPEHLAFYFNTDLSDAVDNIQQLVEALRNGGTQLQEVMSQALTRGGQLFRREIDYTGVSLDVKFDASKEARDREYADAITGYVRQVIEKDFKITNDLEGGMNSPVAVANRLLEAGNIDQAQYDEIIEQAREDMGKPKKEQRLRVNFTPTNNVIHNLMGNLMVAAKADGTVDEVIAAMTAVDEDGKPAPQKPIVGLDKTNAALLQDFVAMRELEVGADMSDFNWASMIELYANKSYNVSISWRGRQNWEAKGQVKREDVSDQDLVAEMDEVVEDARQGLAFIDLPLSPIDYISQRIQDRAQKELGKQVRVAEITGRHNGGIGIDYSGDTPVLKRLPKINARNTIDAFNGGEAESPMDEADWIDALIINRSGSTGISAHSSIKHGDRRERHMIIIEPAGDINIFQQMLGRIFRTGMGDTMPHYTIMGASIPADARTIAVLRKKMESLNAQTSSNKEGATGVDIVDFLNKYGDEIVEDWINDNTTFSELFPNWASKKAENKLAYWASARIGLMPFSMQENFFEEVTDKYLAYIAELDERGENDLEQQFHDWKGIPREEIKIAEVKQGTEGTGFASGSYIVRYLIEKEFKPMSGKDVIAEVRANENAEVKPDPAAEKEAVEKLVQIQEDSKEKFKKLTEVAPGAKEALLKDEAIPLLEAAFQAGIDYLSGKTDTLPQILVEEYDKITHQNLQAAAIAVNRKTAIEQAIGAMKAIYNKATAKNLLRQKLETYKVGNVLRVPKSETSKAYDATIIKSEWKPERDNPWGLGNIQLTLAANGGGKARKTLSIATLQNIKFTEGDRTHTVTVNEHVTDDDLIYIHDKAGDTSSTEDAWIVVGNPLLAASELTVRGTYLRFTDKWGRVMQGIRLPDTLIEAEGIEGTYNGNVEIPSADVILNFFKDNYYGEFATERGFATRYGTTRITADKYDNKKIKFQFRNSDGLEKFNDRNLQALLKQAEIGVAVDENFHTFAVSREDAGPILTEVMRRARLLVGKPDAPQLRDYMTLPKPNKATNKTGIKYTEAQTIHYENDIYAERGEFKSARGKIFHGFYIHGASVPVVERINSASKNMRNEQGGFFVFDNKFAPGGDVEKVLGSPLSMVGKDQESSFALGGLVKGVTKAAVDVVLDSLPFAMKRIVTVVQSENQLPESIRNDIRKDGAWGRVRGVYKDGKVYIVADNLYTADQAQIVFLHEVIGHLGLRKVMGKELVPLLRQVALRYPKQMKEIARRYKLNLNTEKGRLKAAEEVLAHIAERDLNPTLLNRFITLFRKFLRSIGFDNLTITQSEVASILRNARKAAEQGFDTDMMLDGDAMYSIKASTADKDSATTPDETVMDALRDGQPIDAAFRAIWAGVELTQLPKLVRKSSAASLRGSMNFYNQHMRWAHPFMQKAARGLIDRYGLDDEFRALEVSIYSKQAEIINEVRDIIKDMEQAGVTDEDANLIHEILTNEAPRQEAWDAVTEPIRKRIEELGLEAVKYDLISEEAFEKNRGAYLHRVYMKYEGNKTNLEKFAQKLMGSRKPRIKGDETIQRGLMIGVPLERLLKETGLSQDDLVVDGEGASIYALEQLSENGQKIVKRTFSMVKPVNPDTDKYKVTQYDVRFTKGGTVRLWRDWTKAERKAMGEITDARYVLGKTFSLLAHDLAHGEFFKQIAANPAWTWHGEGAPDEYADNELGKFGVSTGYEWHKVPKTKVHPKSRTLKYGALAGKYVRSEIYQHLNQVQVMQKSGFWKEIMTQFKLNKTARNPVVHFNNIMSNLVLMDMADVRISDLYAAVKEIRAKGAVYDEAKRHGALGSSFAEKELKNDVLDKLLEDMQDVAGVKPLGLEDIFMSMNKLPMNKQIAIFARIADGLWNGVDIKGRKVGLRAFDKKMLDYYQHEDEIFRMATYIRRRSQGMGEVEAGISARDQFLNYDITAPWINAAKAVALPFISYTYRAVPIVARSMMNRPWKMAKYFTIAYGANALGYALSGGDEEKERKSLREEASGRLWIGADRMMRMPFNDEQGNPYFWDIRRLIPVGDVFDLNQHHAALPIIPAPLFPSGPAGMFAEFLLNKTSFFGEQIVDWEADDSMIATQKTMDWLWKSYGPSAPWIPYSYYADKIAIASRGGRDRLGREYSILEALASSVGVKIAKHDVSYGMALKGMEIERTIKAIRHHLNFLEKDFWQGKIQKKDYEARRARYINQIKRQNERARELFGG